MTLPWQPFREPLRNTLQRNIIIALVVSAVLIVTVGRGAFDRWPFAAILVFWVTFGGHWVEIFFLNWLRPRLNAKRAIQVAARFGVWFAGGTVLGICVWLTATLMVGARLNQQPAWWMGGLIFIAVELVVHVTLQLRGLPSFYNGRG